MDSESSGDERPQDGGEKGERADLPPVVGLFHPSLRKVRSQLILQWGRTGELQQEPDFIDSEG